MFDDPAAPITARQAYAEGTQRCPSFIPLWTSFVVFEERHSSASRARAVLDKARAKNPTNDELWSVCVARSSDGLCVALRVVSFGHLVVQTGRALAMMTAKVSGVRARPPTAWSLAGHAGRDALHLI